MADIDPGGIFEVGEQEIKITLITVGDQRNDKSFKTLNAPGKSFGVPGALVAAAPNFSNAG